jgi:magnesium-transporting ATPase (P-type)
MMAQKDQQHHTTEWATPPLASSVDDPVDSPSATPFVVPISHSLHHRSHDGTVSGDGDRDNDVPPQTNSHNEDTCAPKQKYETRLSSNLSTWLCCISSIICGIMSFTSYICTLHPSIAGGDTGDIITSSISLGVAHPPGYPLVIIIYHITERLLRYFNIGESSSYRVNVINAALQSITVAALCWLVTTMTLTSRLRSSPLSSSQSSYATISLLWSCVLGVYTSLTFAYTLQVWMYAIAGMYSFL